MPSISGGRSSATSLRTGTNCDAGLTAADGSPYGASFSKAYNCEDIGDRRRRTRTRARMEARAEPVGGENLVRAGKRRNCEGRRMRAARREERESGGGSGGQTRGGF